MSAMTIYIPYRFWIIIAKESISFVILSANDFTTRTLATFVNNNNSVHFCVPPNILNVIYVQCVCVLDYNYILIACEIISLASSLPFTRRWTESFVVEALRFWPDSRVKYSNDDITFSWCSICLKWKANKIP